MKKAKTIVDEGEKLVAERQKHIRIADRSENGWATVEEYVEDELADNSDDEKRLSRADARAGKKLKSSAQRGSRFVKRPGPARRTPANFPGPRNLAFASNHAPAGFNQPPMAAAGLLPAPLAVQPTIKWQVPGGAGYGPCFECGMVGHLKKTAPS